MERKRESSFCHLLGNCNWERFIKWRLFCFIHRPIIHSSVRIVWFLPTETWRLGMILHCVFTIDNKNTRKDETINCQNYILFFISRFSQFPRSTLKIVYSRKSSVFVRNHHESCYWVPHISVVARLGSIILFSQCTTNWVNNQVMEIGRLIFFIISIIIKSIFDYNFYIPQCFRIS